MSIVDEISVKLLYGSMSTVIEINGNEYSQLKEMARIIIDNDAWEYVLDRENPEIRKKEWDKYVQENWPLV